MAGQLLVIKLTSAQLSFAAAGTLLSLATNLGWTVHARFGEQKSLIKIEGRCTTNLKYTSSINQCNLKLKSSKTFLKTDVFRIKEFKFRLSVFKLWELLKKDMK